MSVIESLIDLILDNIYVVAVVLFFLFKLFTGSSSKPKQTSMPTFGGEPHQQPKQWADDEDDDSKDRVDYKQIELEQQRRQQELELQRQREQEAAERRRAEEASRLQRTAETISIEEIKRKRALAEQTRAQKAQKTQAKAEPIASLKAKQVKRSDLQNAVIWSEILGPPRAKRPHRR